MDQIYITSSKLHKEKYYSFTCKWIKTVKEIEYSILRVRKFIYYVIIDTISQTKYLCPV